MRSKLFRATAALLLSGLISGFASSPPRRQAVAAPFQETRRSETLAPGIEHMEMVRTAGEHGTAADRWAIHILVIDPAQARLAAVRAMDEVVGAEPVSSLAARHGALAAVNGGYFRTTGIYRGEPAGLFASGGRVLSEPSGPRAELAVSNEGGRTRIFISQIEAKTAIVLESGTPRPVDGINRPRGTDEMILFTPEFHRTTLTGPGGIEAVIERGVVRAVHDHAGSAAIPADGCVLSAEGTSAGWARDRMKVGTRIEVRTDISADPALPFTPDFMIGGGPYLVRAGRPLGSAGAGLEKFSEDFIRNRHPRTAIGVRNDGRLVIVTVDGRRPGKSVGMTVDELAQLVAGLACVEAVNLDGGGSTTMVVGGKVVNLPSDPGGERPVSDALLVVRRD